MTASVHIRLNYRTADRYYLYTRASDACRVPMSEWLRGVLDYAAGLERPGWLARQPRRWVPAPDDVTTTEGSIRASAEQRDRWQKCADRSGRTLREWIILIADCAAGLPLGDEIGRVTRAA